MKKQNAEEGFFIRPDAGAFRAAAWLTSTGGLVPVRRKMIPRVVMTSKVSQSSMNLVLMLARTHVHVCLCSYIHVHSASHRRVC